MQDKNIEAFWQEYLEALPSTSQVSGEKYGVKSFGDSPEMTDELDGLAKMGTRWL